jgi:hypothetical protein
LGSEETGNILLFECECFVLDEGVSSGESRRALESYESLPAIGGVHPEEGIDREYVTEVPLEVPLQDVTLLSKFS